MQSELQKSELRILLEILANPDHEQYQQGWREFDRRYRKIILGRILTITTVHADVSDISQKMMERLMTENFKALRRFRARDNEEKFKGWLSIIARRDAIQHVNARKRFVNLEEDIPEAENKGSCSEKQTHETWVPRLRKTLKQTQKREAVLERHIFVYLLRKVYQFKAKEVEEIPILEITAGNIDNVINRINIALKK